VRENPGGFENKMMCLFCYEINNMHELSSYSYSSYLYRIEDIIEDKYEGQN